MNRPVPISVFSDQHRTKSTTRSRTSCGTHTLVRAPQDFFLRRCVRPSIRPTPRLWCGSSSPGTRSVAVRLDGPGGSCQRRPQRHSRKTLFANDRTPSAAVPVHHTDRKPALYPTSAASGWQPSLLRCSAFALFSCVLSVILTEERPLQFQLRQDKSGSRLRDGEHMVGCWLDDLQQGHFEESYTRDRICGPPACCLDSTHGPSVGQSQQTRSKTIYANGPEDGPPLTYFP